jgi:uncharacterized membrane protein YgcG
MVVIYAGSFPSDPETDLKNFQGKQAEYEAAYRRTGEPLALYEALLHATAAGQPTPDWLVTAIGDIIVRGRNDQAARRFQERVRHVRRYRLVRDLRRRGHTKDCALELAVAALEATDAAGARSTIENSYDRVRRDLERAGRESEYFFLVARSDPTVVPVSQAQIDHIKQNGADRCPNGQGGDSSPSSQGGDSSPSSQGGDSSPSSQGDDSSPSSHS